MSKQIRFITNTIRSTVLSFSYKTSAITPVLRSLRTIIALFAEKLCANGRDILVSVFIGIFCYREFCLVYHRFYSVSLTIVSHRMFNEFPHSFVFCHLRVKESVSVVHHKTIFFTGRFLDNSSRHIMYNARVFSIGFYVFFLYFSKKSPVFNVPRVIIRTFPKNNAIDFWAFDARKAHIHTLICSLISPPKAIYSLPDFD
mmetsp:Transcript_11140/g.23672  ORF Transcript_11140/g.23672 Transcript_11140/m.23672 type:complete len:200 (+) Transcript_11140:103-702(+)